MNSDKYLDKIFSLITPKMTILIAYKMEDLFSIVNQTFDFTGAKTRKKGQKLHFTLAEEGGFSTSDFFLLLKILD